MEIFLPKRAVRQIRLSAHDAIEEGDTDTLREDIIEAFGDDQIEEIERRVDSGDFYELVSDVLDEWPGDEVDELFEILEQLLTDVGIELKYSDPEYDDDDEEDELDDEDDLDYDLEDDDL